MAHVLPTSKIVKTPTCWLWRGRHTGGGYGQIVIERRRVYVHRIAYEAAHGPIPAGYVVLHSCDNPPCVNPAHLSIGTQADNVRDAIDKGHYRGARNGQAKLTADQAAYIRRSTARGVDLARRFGVHDSTISNIRTGKRWAEAA